MPRSGAITLTDLIGPTLTVCEPCDRRGDYSVPRLQAKHGDAHVYGAKSRFMTDKVLACFEQTTFRSLRGVETLREGEAATVDVVAQLKDMW